VCAITRKQSSTPGSFANAHYYIRFDTSSICFTIAV
jgi:hypothetical protein